jgi:polysaccharide deacetylase family protein (PEP-CTERM system associated)
VRADQDERGTEQERATPAGPLDPQRTHLLSVVLEDYFQVAPLKSVVHNDQWYRFERRVEENTLKALALLDEFGIHATFFVLGWIADEMPDLVREVAGRGHEVASKGYAHRSIRQLSRDGFRDDLRRSRAALERASGTAVHGYRIAHSWFSPEDLWALDVLIAEGFRYDSSIRPLFWRYARQPWRCEPHLHPSEKGSIWEFPLPSWTAGGWSFPISGGNYLRQLPHWLMKRVVAGWIRKTTAPFLMYFHVWELDPQQPRIRAVPLRERVRQYRNLDKMETVIRHYLSRMRFVAIADYLRLRDGDEDPVAEWSPPEAMAVAPVVEPAAAVGPGAELRAPITVVVPCFNEELILPYLANTLRSVERKLEGEYDLRLIFVDDGSTDTTWASLNELFGERRDCVILRHQRNQGVAAAILTGLRAAGTEIVCSIDCDCTYDPHQLSRLIPLLVPGVDMVTASPYHRDGLVRNVPGWRLFLSKSLSRLYRLVLTHQLATYTSCFRVYRRAAVAGLQVQEKGFLGVAEMLGLLDLDGARIVECPAVLEVRLLGRSKMKTVRTIGGHLRLLLKLGAMRLFGRRDRGAGDSIEPPQ